MLKIIVEAAAYHACMNQLEAMRYLVALEQHRHFGRAAQACHITQPALSNALRALEQQYGVTIVRRSRQYEGLTPEGERVVVSARRMLHEHQLLQQELQSDIDRPRGTLRIGAVPTAMPIVARFAACLQARYPDIRPVVLSLASSEIETGVETLTLDLGLGYIDRPGQRGAAMLSMPQYVEHYFLVRRASQLARTESERLQRGPAISWAAAAALPLCLLTPEMHNRTIVDQAFAQAGTPVQPVIETNSILTLSLSVVAGEVCSVLPGALVGAIRGYRELEALPLVGPDLRTPIGFMTTQFERPSRTLQAALALAREPEWLRHAAAHSGPLDD